jgi:hypothetical protein
MLCFVIFAKNQQDLTTPLLLITLLQVTLTALLQQLTGLVIAAGEVSHLYRLVAPGGHNWGWVKGQANTGMYHPDQILVCIVAFEKLGCRLALWSKL